MTVFRNAVRENFIALGERDIKWVRRAVAGWAILDLFLEDSTPKKYALEVLVRKSKVDRRRGFASLVVDAVEGIPNGAVAPSQLNEKLAKRIREGVFKDLWRLDPVEDDEYKLFLRPSDMTWILSQLHDATIYDGETPRAFPGPPKVNDVPPNQGGGRPSWHILASDFREMQETLSKPLIRDYIFGLVEESGLLFRYERFMILARFYAIIEDENFMNRIAKAVGSRSFDQEQIRAHREELKNLKSQELYGLATSEARARISQGWSKEEKSYVLMALFREFV